VNRLEDGSVNVVESAIESYRYTMKNCGGGVVVVVVANNNPYECMFILTRCACTVLVRPLVGTLGCCWAAPTVKRMMVMDNAFVVSFSCLFQCKQVQRFTPLDRSCKD
jgi:hypothetical protein